MRDRQRKYHGLSKSQISSLGSKDKPKRGGEAHKRSCCICGKDSSHTEWRRRPGLRLDGQPFSLYPLFYKSDIVSGGYECTHCRRRNYYQKNRDVELAKNKAYREMRKRLYEYRMRSIIALGKKYKKKR